MCNTRSCEALEIFGHLKKWFKKSLKVTTSTIFCNSLTFLTNIYRFKQNGACKVHFMVYESVNCLKCSPKVIKLLYHVMPHEQHGPWFTIKDVFWVMLLWLCYFFPKAAGIHCGLDWQILTHFKIRMQVFFDSWLVSLFFLHR